jgi:putative membrane protein
MFVGVWIALAVDPRYRLVWALENLPTVVFVPALVLTYQRFRFSGRAYVQMTGFLILHTIGSYYSYAETPIGAWVRDALGGTRNPYDRIVHFSFGALLLLPLREAAFPAGRRRGELHELGIAFALISCASLLYELVEWAVAVLAATSIGAAVRGAAAAGAAFLAAQGDPWDAHKDMALACAGALVGAAAELGTRRLRARDRALAPG